jgi:hypothetical protein
MPSPDRGTTKAVGDLFFGQDDPDVGVRKVVLKSAAGFKSSAVTARGKRRAEEDPESFVPELAESTVKAMKKRKK